MARPPREPLHARRPIGLGNSGLERFRSKLQLADGAQRGDGDPGILELVPPVELGRRKVEQAGVILIDEAPTLLGRHPVLARNPDRRLDARRLALDRYQRLARLRGHDRRHVRLENTGLLPRDLPDAVAEMFGMIERHRRDDTGE